MKMSRLWVILPVFNRIKKTYEFIDALKSQAGIVPRLVLVDDGSTDGTSEMAQKAYPAAIIVHGNGNLWWAGGVQAGFDAIRSIAAPDDVVCIINNDVSVDISYFRRGFESAKDGYIIGSKILCSNGDIDVGFFYDSLRLLFSPASEAEKLNCLSTCGIFFKWSMLSVVGEFYPKILPHYLSDYEFTYRAHCVGVALLVDDKLLIKRDSTTTGYHPQLMGASLFENFKLIFSKRSAANPFFWSVFIWLTNRWWVFPFVLMNFWIGGLATFFRRVFGRRRGR